MPDIRFVPIDPILDAAFSIWQGIDIYVYLFCGVAFAFFLMRGLLAIFGRR